MTKALNLNFILLYVENVEHGEKFYARLLGREAIESSPTFAMFPLAAEDTPREKAMFLGLWRRDTVEPAAPAAPGGSEFAFVVATPADVNRVHDEWLDMGVSIIQAPAKMDFGTTFTAADPDGHRIRVFSRAG